MFTENHISDCCRWMSQSKKFQKTFLSECKTGYDFCSFEEEYRVTLHTCQSADWRACTALICKHAEQASHQVEDGLNAVMATEVCLAGAHAVAKTNSLEDNPGMGHQSINPCHWNCNRASAKRMVGHEVIAKPR